MRRFLVPLLALLLATSASADWPAGGKLVSSPGDINGVRNARIIELPSGDLIVLGVGSGGSSNTYNLQRLLRTGQLAIGWPANGVQMAGVIKGLPLRTQSVIADDATRVWRSFPSGSGAQLQYVDPDAARVPNGSPYSTGTNCTVIHAAPASGGEVFMVTGPHSLKRITPMGTPAAGWSANGVALPGDPNFDHALIPDGSGGVVVFMRQDVSGGPPLAARYDGNGAIHAGWLSGGVQLSSIPVANDLATDSQLLPSGPDHMLAVWSLDAGSGKRRLMMQRFGLDATRDANWPDDGLEVVAADTISACRAIADGAGGAYVVRQAHGRPVGTHITSAGTVLGTPDIDLLDAGAQYVPTRVGSPNLGVPDELIADVTSDGNLLIGWNDTRLAPAVSFRLRWLTPALAPAADKPSDGLVFSPGSPHPYAGAMLTLHADGPSGAFIAWGDYHDIGFSQVFGDVWMAYVQVPTTTGVGSSAPTLSLSAPRPNPATSSVVLDLTLPDDTGARVELLDVAGRVVRSQLVAGAGPHAITFDRLGSLAPGLYFARVTSRDRSSSVRVVVSR